MPYVGQKPADIISTAVDTVTGKFSGEVDAASLDISGNIDVDGTTNLDVVDIDGAVDMATTLGVAGVVTANAGVVVDNITIDGTEIDLSSGDLTVDVAGDIILDADGGNVKLKDGGTEYGKLAIDGGDLTIDGGSEHTGLRFEATDITPRHNRGASDGVNDLGTSGARFKDLYLSGGAFLGGTGSANELDDYEEGTWTPTLVDDSGNAATVNSGSTGGTYTKIGRMVALTGRCTTSSVSGLSNIIFIKTLPFAALTGQQGYATLGVSESFNLNITAGENVIASIGPGATKAALRVWDNGGGNTAMTPAEWSDDGYVMFSGVYVT